MMLISAATNYQIKAKYIEKKELTIQIVHISHLSWKVGDYCAGLIVDERGEIADWCIAGTIMKLGNQVAIPNYTLAIRSQIET